MMNNQITRSCINPFTNSIQHIPDQQAVVELVDVVAEVYLGEDVLELELTSNQKKLQNQQIQEI